MGEQEDKQLVSEAMRLLGKRKSEKKAQSARENGKKGGRPRKAKPEEEEHTPTT